MGKTLSDHVEIIDPLDSLCTKRTAETYGINTPDYTLSTLCQQFGIEPSAHHDALRDATVCMEPFHAMRSEHLIDLISASIYQRILYIHKSGNIPDDNASTTMTNLNGITLGVALDGRITAPEQRTSSDWMNHHTEYGTHGDADVFPCL